MKLNPLSKAKLKRIGCFYCCGWIGNLSVVLNNKKRITPAFKTLFPRKKELSGVG
jgi:hypothetical protein